MLVCGNGLLALVFVAIAPVLSTFAEHMGGGTDGAFAAQMLMSMPGIGIVLSGPIWGFLIRRLGPRLPLFLALGSYAFFGFSGYFLKSTFLLLGSRLLLGSAVAGVMTATSFLITRLGRDGTPEHLFGIQGAVGAGVALAGVWAAGILGHVGGWRAPLALFLIALPLLLVTLVALRGSDLSSATVQPPVPEGSKERPILVRLWPFYLLVFVMSIVYNMTGTQTGLVLAEDNVRNPLVQSVILSMASASGVVAGLIYGRIRRRANAFGMAQIILFFWALGQSAIGLSHYPYAIAAGVAVSGFGSGLMMAFLAPLLVSQAEPAAHSRVLGLLYSTMFLGDFANPLVMSGLRTVLASYHDVFLTIGICCMIAFAALTALRSRLSSQK